LQLYCQYKASYFTTSFTPVPKWIAQGKCTTIKHTKQTYYYQWKLIKSQTMTKTQ